MITRLLVSNRGEIARRITRTARKLGITTVAVYAEVDRHLPFVLEADEAYSLGDGSVTTTYLDIDKVLAIAIENHCNAVHPGYGLLSENAKFASAILGEGLRWVGPDPETITQVGDKVAARNLVGDAGVPVARGGRTAVSTPDEAVEVARQIGYPVMLKPTAGGGGIGMTIAQNDDDVAIAIRSISDRGRRFFGDGGVLVEQFIPAARHIEVQILGFGDGRVIHLGERDCSTQRRHQKVIEESPAPNLAPAVRDKIHQAAVQAGRAVNYRGAGTVEFLMNAHTDEFVFCELNARLQVEHPITELVTGVDLVAEQLRIADGCSPTMTTDIPPHGHAFELRIYAEDPVSFLPSPGIISRWSEPAGEGIRVDSGYHQGNEVSPYFDPLLAKLCVWGTDRDHALERAQHALDEFVVEGIKTNIPLLARLLAEPMFRSGSYDTGLIDSIRPALTNTRTSRGVNRP